MSKRSKMERKEWFARKSIERILNALDMKNDPRLDGCLERISRAGYRAILVAPSTYRVVSQCEACLNCLDCPYIDSYQSGDDRGTKCPNFCGTEVAQ